MLHRECYQILPLGRIVRTTPVEGRTIDAGFFGIGLSHLRVEAVIAMTNKLLMHYGCNTATGQLMQTSYLLFFSELGLSFTPLQESYNRYSFLVTHSWMKMLWEKVSKFDIKIVMTAASQKCPREGNQFIMQVLARKGYNLDALLWLNRVRISLQLLFMSDILTASGNTINTEILLCCLPMVSNSDMRWPQGQPTNSDMQLWKNAILSICPSRCTTHSMGRFISNTHRLWHWSWCKEDSMLRRLNTDGETEDVFISDKKPNRFHYSHSQPRSNQRVVWSVMPTIDGEHWRLLSTAPCAATIFAPSTFLEVLEAWGNTWLWEHMTVTGGITWVHESIAQGTLVAVTDGSYIRELFPHICLAAFVLECSHRRRRIFGSFSESLRVANAYRGELLGLMAIHLILLSVNKIH